MSVGIPKEGDDLTAASINDRFTELQAVFNDLVEADLARWCLTSDHLPSRATGGGLFSTYSAVSDPTTVAAGLRYDNTIPSTGAANPSGGINSYLASFHTQVYGPYTSPGFGGAHSADEGWLIPSDSAGAGSTYKMEVALDSANNLSGLVGVRVTAWIGVVDARDTFVDDPELAIYAPAVVYQGERCIYFGIGVEDSAGNREIIPRSIRRYSAPAWRRGPITTKTLVQAGDLSGGSLNGTCAKIFGAVISGLWDSNRSQHGTTSPYFKHYAIVVEPIQGGALA